MTRRRDSKAFGKRGTAAAAAAPGKTGAAAKGGSPAAAPRKRGQQQAIPDAVARRMARRIAVATGLPTLAGMGVFVASYLLVSRGILDIPPAITLVSSGACFLLGLLGLTYGVLSASWEDEPGTLLGFEQLGVNLERVRSSVRAMRHAPRSGGSAGS